ncbi:MAG: aldo/keto reductase [Saprospiraceae bacterium]|nr:aldo/keto reductase [Saprospiraceae bacterium]MDZ4703189.1 aldo/keto reductase [Saprospiraceae bacterium]
MEYRRLGKSGVQVSALSLGSWLTFGKQISDDMAERLMAIAYERGVNFFDNAEGYAAGKSEIVMGNILKKMNWDRTSYLVSSKVFFGAGGNKPNQTGLSRKHLMEACHAALKRLQVDYLDFYYCHRPDPHVPIDEIVWAMNHLIQQGKVLYWGVSEWPAKSIEEAHLVAQKCNLIGPTMEQPQYNLFVRERVELEYAPLYKRFGLGTTIWSPLASGVLTNKYIDASPEDTRLGIKGMEWLRDSSLTPERLEKVRQLHALAGEIGTSLPCLAIAWCLKNPNISTVILGASKEYQLEETLGAIETLSLLTDPVMERIEAIVDNKPEETGEA